MRSRSHKLSEAALTTGVELEDVERAAIGVDGTYDAVLALLALRCRSRAAESLMAPMGRSSDERR